MDKVRQEALRLARNDVMTMLRLNGVRVSRYSCETITDAAEKLLARSIYYKVQARRNMERSNGK